MVFKRNDNIKIHRDITGEMWFGVGETLTFKAVLTTLAGHGVILTTTLSKNISPISSEPFMFISTAK